MKQLAFKEWKSGKKQQLPIEGTGQDHPAGGSPARRPPNIWTFFADSLCPYSSAWLNLNLLSEGRSNWSNS